jgi:predicted dehydrogenase
MKKNAVLIGLGNISKSYHEGLAASPNLNLAGVCDKNPDAAGRSLYNDVPFFNDYTEAIQQTNSEFAVVCTPPAVHFEMVKDLLQRDINVLVEKPATTNLRDLEILTQLAKDKQLFFDCILHWQGGGEVIFLREYAKKLGALLSTSTTVQDPYTDAPNQIKSDKAELSGAWLDSGINILSMLSKFLPIDQLSLTNQQTAFDEKLGLPSFVNLSLQSGKTPMQIMINWNSDIAYKKSSLVFEKGTVDLFHSNQFATLNGEEIYRDTTLPRLPEHYYNYFTKLLPEMLKNPETKDDAIELHKTLFDIEAKLQRESGGGTK